jgi:hypothetical protein
MYGQFYCIEITSNKFSLATFNENIRATEYKRASLRHHNAVNEYNGKRRELENELARYKMYVI